jgi:hypothetical protein
MHKLIHKLIRYKRDGVNIVADINAAIATGESGASTSTAHSYSRIVQRNGRQADSETNQSKKEVNRDEADS